MKPATRPATSLPWEAMEPYNAPLRGADYKDIFYYECDHGESYVASDRQDRAYAAHTANAYPRLVEALGELAFPYKAQFKRDEAEAKAQALLRELGELE